MYYSLISSMKKGSGFDADAQAFITATAITDSTQQNAINTLVLNFKSYGIWTKMKAIYPMVSDAATSALRAEQHKYNLKDPRDLNAAFRLSFVGGWTHSATGALPSGSTGFADTFLNPATVIANVNDGHLSYYSRTNSSGINQIDMGTFDGTSAFDMVIKFGGGNLAGACINMSDANVFTNATASTGLYHANQNNIANVRKMFKNGSVLATQTIAQNLQPSQSIYVGARGGVASGFFTNRQCAFASVGNGLTDTEAANFYTAVQAFQTTLSRQI